MNNDDWIKFQDSIPHDQRWIFEHTREHDDSALTSMLGALLKSLNGIEEKQESLEEKQDAFSHPLGALVAKQDLITEHLAAQFAALNGLKEGQAVLRSEFQATGESLNQWQANTEATLAAHAAALVAHAATLASHNSSRDDSIAERTALRDDLEESKSDRLAIRAEQHVHNEVVTVKLNELAAAIEELKHGVNGRLTQLIKESKAASRAQGQAEGHDEERADPGSG